MHPDELLAQYYLEHEGRDLDLQQFVLQAIHGQRGVCSVDTAREFLDRLEVVLLSNAAARGGGASRAESAASAIAQEIQEIRTLLLSPRPPDV